jgi:DNA-binding NarL/FixJ family response regulator
LEQTAQKGGPDRKLKSAELEVLQLIVNGKTNREIAADLDQAKIR